MTIPVQLDAAAPSFTPDDKSVAEAMKNLEGDVYSAHCSTGVLIDLLENNLKSEERDGAGFHVYRLNEDQVRLIWFCAHDAESRAKHLHDAYMLAFGGKTDG